MKTLALGCIVACAILPSFRAQAGITYNESVQGDFSDNRLSPTQLTFRYGSNLLSGTFGQGASPGEHDLDYFSVVIPPGRVLTRIIVLSYFDDFNLSFIGVQAGPIFTVPSDVADASALLGWTHFSQSDVGLDILGAIGGGPGAQGFTPPLTSGTYTFWLQEVQTGFFEPYNFDFQVESATGCPADLNGDGFVEDADFVDFVVGYNILDCADGSMPQWCPADLNGDGLVDDSDFVLFVGAYNDLLCP